MNQNEFSATSVRAMLGRRVRNPAGESLGHIEDVVVDLNTARVSYAVLSVGGFLGIGDHEVAVPLEAFSLDVDLLEFVLDTDRTTLETAPDIADLGDPPIADAEWRRRVYSHFGRTPQS